MEVLRITQCLVTDHRSRTRRIPAFSTPRVLAHTRGRMARQCWRHGIDQFQTKIKQIGETRRSPKHTEKPLSPATLPLPRISRRRCVHQPGAIEDSFYQATGRRLYDASSITANVLIVRAENDFWSRPEDVEALAQHLTRAHTVRVLRISHPTHFVHLDRPEHGRDVLISAVREFLETGRP